MRCDTVCGGGVPEGTMALAPLSASFQSLSLLPTSKLSPSGAHSQVGGFASLVECFFFNSLVVGLPYSLIFCQFWLFFVFKFVVVLLFAV